MKLMTIGGATIDIFFTQEDSNLKRVTGDEETYLLVAEGAKIIMDDAHIATGGGATNAAAVMASLGIEVATCAMIGDDPFGTFLREQLHEHDIATDYILTTEQKSTAISTIIPSPSGNRIIFVYRGANAYMTPEHIPASISDYDGAYITSLAQEATTYIAEIAETAQRATGSVAHNPGSEELEDATDTLCDALEHIDMLIVNAREARRLMAHMSTDPACVRRLCERTQPHQAHDAPQLLTEFDTLEETCIDIRAFMQEIIDRGVTTVMVTHGAEGIYIGHEDQLTFAQAPSVDVTCSVGAGDTCGSTFFTYRMLGASVGQAAAKALRNSCYVLQTVDAKSGTASREDLADVSDAAITTYPLRPVTEH